MQDMQVRSLGQEDPWEKEMVIHPVFLLGKSHGQRSLVGYSPRGHERVGHGLVIKQQQQHMFYKERLQKKNVRGPGRPSDEIWHVSQVLKQTGTCMLEKWLGLHASTARGTGLIPGQGNKVSRAHDMAKTKKETIHQGL